MSNDLIFAVRWNDLLLIVAGTLAMATAVVHGHVMRRYIVVPLEKLLKEEGTLRGASRRLVTPLLNVSTVAWFVGGGLLTWAGFRAQGESKVAVSIAILALYFHAAVLNAWATRGRHPGWIIMAVAVALIIASLIVGTA